MLNIITLPADADIVCACGNQPHHDGFYPCDDEGNEMEPTIKSNWGGLYICPRCQQFYTFI